MEQSIHSRIGSLIRLLASDKDGEVVACVVALRRQLTTAGLDFNDLADMFMAPKPSSAPRVATSSHYAQVLDWIIKNKFECLTIREQEFVTSMVSWCEFGEPTGKQRDWIKKIVAKVDRV